MSETLSIRLRTLTPLWTGGVDGTVDRIHETSILGSLRWWYEAIVRGLGGEACDPTQHAHELTGHRLRQYENARREGKDWWEALDKAGLCDACKVFGTTGWHRRFRLEVVEDKTKPLWEPEGRMLNIRPPHRNRGWFLPPGQMGIIQLQLRGDAIVLPLLAKLFLFAEQWGNIGAKPQLGYGVFQIENREEVEHWARKWKWEVIGDREPDPNVPDLRHFGFFRYRFTPERPGWWRHVPGIKRVVADVQPLAWDYRTVPVVPALKNEWRFHRWQRRWGDAREAFGTLRPTRQRGRMTASWAYPVDDTWEVRGWIWLSNKQWADQAWEMISDGTSWQVALRVEGELETQRIHSKEEALDFLEEMNSTV